MEDKNEILETIEREKDISLDESFRIISYCTRLLSNHEAEAEMWARRICIHILNNWNKVSPNAYGVWAELIESLGFYPYIKKNQVNLKLHSIADSIRMGYYQSDFLEETYFHKEQKKISNTLLKGKNLIASAPTSFGKSLLIEEVVASKKYNNIIIIQPTLALLDETRLKLKKYAEIYKIIVRTSQPPSEEKRNLFLLTAERVMEYEALPKIDFLIIDEFYKLSLKREDNRADALNNAFLKVVDAFHPKFYFLGPNIDGITEGFAEKYNATFYKSDFSLVDCNVIDKSYLIEWDKSDKAIDNHKVQILCELLDDLGNEQTLIYCSTPARARRIAKLYLKHVLLKQENIQQQLPLVDWINKNVSPQWSLARELQYGIAIHDGSLQKHIGASIIRYFNKGLLKCIFCTSTIIEGVNTSAKNVILFDEKKGSSKIDFFDYSNIKGRSGRMMEHYVGKIFNFCRVPQKESIIIDIPFYEQNPKVLTNEILVHIKDEDVQQQVRERYDQINTLPADLLKVIKQNGVSINGQIRIYNKLISDMKSKDGLDNIQWSQLPSYTQMSYVLEVAENNLFDFESKRGVFSVKQLAWYLNMYRTKKNIIDIVTDIYEKRIQTVVNLTDERQQKYYDEAVETAFHIYRHWFQFTVPKAFRVVDSIQRLICERNRIKPGSYSFFVQQLENDFIRENLSILVEFGIPSDAVRRLEKLIPSNLTEDEVIEFVKKNRYALDKMLLPYERERLDSCI